jgi:ribosomal protein S18 acetylase RimI-like enzyme
MMQVRPVAPGEGEAVLALYRSLLSQEGVTWDEDYPNAEIIAEDIASGNLYAAFEDGRIVAAAAFEEDEEMDAHPFWTAPAPAATISRVAVRADKQGQGLAKDLIRQVMEEMKMRGYRSARYLVGVCNLRAQAAYRALNFRKAGEADCYGQHWLCFEKAL